MPNIEVIFPVYRVYEGCPIFNEVMFTKHIQPTVSLAMG